MDVQIYEKKPINKRKAEIVPYIETKKNYYEEEIKYLYEDEVKRLFKGPIKPFYKMLFLFLFETAARVGEALMVKISDIDFINKTVKLFTLKRRGKIIIRVLPLSDSLLNSILLYERHQGLQKDDFLFAQSSHKKAITVQAINKQCKVYFGKILGDAYMDRANPHTFRHSRAIQLLNSGKCDIVKLKNILGHKNIANTLIYLRYANKDIQDSIRLATEELGIRI